MTLIQFYDLKIDKRTGENNKRNTPLAEHFDPSHKGSKISLLFNHRQKTIWGEIWNSTTCPDPGKFFWFSWLLHTWNANFKFHDLPCEPCLHCACTGSPQFKSQSLLGKAAALIFSTHGQAIVRSRANAAILNGRSGTEKPSETIRNSLTILQTLDPVFSRFQTSAHLIEHKLFKMAPTR